MKHIIFCLLFVLAVFAVSASAGGVRRVELRDGSVLLGEIVSMQGDVVTLRSETLGLVKIDASRIRNIRMEGASSDAEGDPVSRLRESMMNDPEIMAMILTLQNNPDVQEVLNDPDITEALNSGNFEALLSNPKIQRLLNNPKIQDIGKKALNRE